MLIKWKPILLSRRKPYLFRKKKPTKTEYAKISIAMLAISSIPQTNIYIRETIGA